MIYTAIDTTPEIVAIDETHPFVAIDTSADFEAAFFWEQLDIPTGTIDGANTIFTLPAEYTSVRYFLNGVEKTEGVDYTVSGTTLTVDPPPETGDEHWILCQL